MLIIAWIISVSRLIQADKVNQAFVQGRCERESQSPADVGRLESDKTSEGQQQKQKRPTHWEDIETRLAWMVPAAVFGCMACLAVFAWIVSWLDRR